MKKFIPALLIALSFNAIADSQTTRARSAMNDNRPTQLDDLIRGEMAAVKTYDTALKKITDPKEKKQLTTIRTNHVNAVEKLKTFADKEVLDDTKTSGAWGAFATAYTGGARLMGDEMALKALTQGEEHGIKEYKEALDDETIKPELKQMIRTQFLPKQEEHIKALKGFM